MDSTDIKNEEENTTRRESLKMNVNRNHFKRTQFFPIKINETNLKTQQKDVVSWKFVYLGL